MADTKKMLVIRLSALGDVAMTIPVVYSLANEYPNVEITVLTRPFFSRVFINRPANVRIMTADFLGEYKGVAGMMRLLKRLHHEHFDYVADLHNVLRSWQIDTYLRLHGAKTQMVDKMRSQRRQLLKGHVKEQPQFLERYRNVLSRLGFPTQVTFKSLFEDAAPTTPIKISHPAIGIAPFARYYNKTYPIAHIDEVIDKLTADGYHVYLFGAAGDEAEGLNRRAEKFDNCTSLAGKFSLEEEIAMMSQMDLMVSMDSANQHLAALAGTRVLTIWGSTTPGCGFTPFGHDADDGIVGGVSCQPCTIAGGIDCPREHFDCMHAIRPEGIVKRIKRIVPQPAK